MPDYEIRLLAENGSVAQIHVTSHPDDEAAIAHAEKLKADIHSGFEIRRGMTQIWPRPG
ncbi:MAG TPA: hypothetical protein VGG48_10795 [Rhizomicrobium sp.]|jgi:hypothetical protein